VDVTGWTTWTEDKLENDKIWTRVTQVKFGTQDITYLDLILLGIWYHGPPTSAHADVDILVRKSDGTVRQTIATNVATSGSLSSTEATLSGTYEWSSYTVEDQTDYLEIDYYVDVAAAFHVNLYLRIDERNLPIADQTKATNVILPNEYTVEVEFTGASNAQSWTKLDWTVDSAWTTGSVSVTLQLYNYATSSYPTSGDGYVAYYSSTTPNTDETRSQTITMNTDDFRDGSGNWKIKVKGIKPNTTSSFLWLSDMVKFAPEGHDVAMTSVMVSTAEASPGQIVYITEVAKNEGTETETFNVTTYFDNTAIGTQTVTNLAPNTQTTLTFNWNTTEVALGTYTIKAEASTVLGEIDTGDNTKIDGTVTIRKEAWPMFHHDLRHTGYSTSKAPKNNNTLWNYTTGYSLFRSSPAVADGKVFIGSTDCVVYALDKNTGALLWSYATGGAVEFSSPAVADGMVFIGSYDKKLYALNASTGAHIWNYTTGGRVQTSPAVANGVVLIGSCDGKVYALDEFTGAPMWNYTTGGPASYYYSSPAVADGMVFIGSVDDRLYALDASTGAYIWNYTTGDDVRSSPTVADGMVFVGSRDSKVYALNEFTGALIWSYTTWDQVISSPAVADGVVFVASWDNNIYALNASTGAYIWNYTTGGTLWSSPAVANGLVFVGSRDSKVYALNETTGALVWHYTTGHYVSSSPAVADGMVFIGSEDKKVYCFGPKPVAYFTSSSDHPAPGIILTFNATLSMPSSGTITSYSWDFGDDNITAISTPIITHLYTSSGTYNVTLTITDSEGLTDTAWKLIPVYMRDIAVTNVMSSKTVVGEGYFTSINLTVENQGDLTETFNVTVYASTRVIETKEITLISEESITLTFTWNTTGVAKGNYTITAEATQLPGETDLDDNTKTDGWVVVTIPGDVNGDRFVNVKDMVLTKSNIGKSW